MPQVNEVSWNYYSLKFIFVYLVLVLWVNYFLECSSSLSNNMSKFYFFNLI